MMETKMPIMMKMKVKVKMPITLMIMMMIMMITIIPKEMDHLTFQNVFVVVTNNSSCRPSLFGITPTESLLETFAEGRSGALSIDSSW
jgi:hypothetical protein